MSSVIGQKNLTDINTTGIPNLKDACVIIVKTEWNKAIVDALEASCLATLNVYGIQNVELYTVPGAFELPFAIRSLLTTAKSTIHLAIAFGCVIQGNTPHFDYVCKAVTDGIVHLNSTQNVPVIFGVLTVLNEQQAIDRVKGGSVGDKGEEAALTAIKMLPYSMA
jgi:6,7-dimethyl-8-ribityllumazine synthase